MQTTFGLWVNLAWQFCYYLPKKVIWSDKLPNSRITKMQTVYLLKILNSFSDRVWKRPGAPADAIEWNRCSEWAILSTFLAFGDQDLLAVCPKWKGMHLSQLWNQDQGLWLFLPKIPTLVPPWHILEIIENWIYTSQSTAGSLSPEWPTNNQSGQR